MGGESLHILTGKVTKIERSVTESQKPDEPVVMEPHGKVEVELGPEDDPVWLTVPFPGGVVEGIRLGQRVTLRFEGFDPDLEEAERRADAGYHDR